MFCFLLFLNTMDSKQTNIISCNGHKMHSGFLMEVTGGSCISRHLPHDLIISAELRHHSEQVDVDTCIASGPLPDLTSRLLLTYRFFFHFSETKRPTQALEGGVAGDSVIIS
jgi:hypothetical protein